MIVVAGKQFKTLNDEIYANDNKVMAAFANNQLVYPDYAYVGTSDASVENVSYIGKWRTQNNELVIDTGTYSILIEMFVYSNIPLSTGTLNGRRILVFAPPATVYYGTTAVIRFKVTATVNGCTIPPSEDNSFWYNNVVPLKPSSKLYNPQYSLNGMSFYSYAFVTTGSTSYQYTFDERYSATLLSLGYPYLTSFYTSGQTLSRIGFMFSDSKCTEATVTNASLQASRRPWGYDSTVWEYAESESSINIINYPSESSAYGSSIYHDRIYFDNSTVQQVSN